MRTMDNDGMKLNIVEHIIIRNFWEYYVTDIPSEDPDIKCCYVMGAECELGDVYMPEIEPYIISRTKNLLGVLPAFGFKWIS